MHYTKIIKQSKFAKETMLIIVIISRIRCVRKCREIIQRISKTTKILLRARLSMQND